MSKRVYQFFVMGALLLALITHLVFLEATPWDWDEPVYTNVANAISQVGFPAFLITGNGQPAFYTYHPPFHFFLMDGWYRLIGHSDIVAGRLLNSIMSIVVVGATMAIVRVITRDRFLTVVAGAILAVDGWFAYSSLLVKLDIVALAIGTIGMLLFMLSLKKGRAEYALLAGIAVGVAVIYKHVAAIFLLAVIINWILTRRNHYLHGVTLLYAGILLTMYISTMVLIVGQPYVDATVVQIRRTLGVQEARGLTYGFTEAIQALITTYWAFSGSILLLGLGGLCAFRKAISHWQGEELELSPITSWVMSAALMLALIRLRNPHYMIYLIVPVAIIGWLELGVRIEVRQWRKEDEGRLARIFVITLLALNFITLLIRVTNFSNINALSAVRIYIADQVLPGTRILADEPICAMVPNPCYRIGIYQSESRLAQARPQIIVLYTSTTQKPPQSEALLGLIGRSTPVYQVAGWKETITVLVVPDNLVPP